MENEWNQQENPVQDEPIPPETPAEGQTVDAAPAADAPLPRFEPSSEYRWVKPARPVEPVEQSAPVAQTPKKAKGEWTAKKVIALTLCCSLLGGLAGAGLTALLTKNDPAMEDQPNVSNVLEGQRENSVIQTHPVQTGKLMTAAEVYAANVNSTVGITTQVTTNFWGYQTTSAASGSGFIYSDDGYILTNYHVIEDATAVSVTTYDGRTLDAKVVGYDESNDIAVLKVEAVKLTPVIIGDSANLNVGDPVVAIGNPLGELTFSLTSGSVSALEREVTFSGGMTMNLIQTDCAINSGNSGGALFNMYGEVIGITNAKYSGSSGGGASIDNIGFAIPMNQVRSIVDSIVENGYMIKPYIGVTIVDVSPETQSYGLPQGASIRSVVEDGPAYDAGLQMNDIVTHIDGQQITGASDFKGIITKSAPGDVLSLTVWRMGQTLQLELTIGQQIQEGIG